MWHKHTISWKQDINIVHKTCDTARQRIKRKLWEFEGRTCILTTACDLDIQQTLAISRIQALTVPFETKFHKITTFCGFHESPL